MKEMVEDQSLTEFDERQILELQNFTFNEKNKPEAIIKNQPHIKTKEMNFDRIDIAILNLVQQDSTITIKEMAKTLNLSTTPIFERLKRLEKAKVIQKYVALLDPKKVGKKLEVFIHISVIDHSIKAIDDFVEQTQKHSEIMECYHVTGDSDFLLKVVVEDIEVYNHFVTTKLSAISNIGNIKSSFSLSTRKKTTAFQLRMVQ